MQQIAVIGTGRIAWQLESDKNRYHPCTHIGALLKLAEKNEQIKLSAFCDLSENLAQEAADYAGHSKNEHQPRVFRDFREALQDKPDVVVIATSTFAHLAILRETIRLGIEKIVVEKPIVGNMSDLRELQKLLKQNPRYLKNIWVNYERRYHKKYTDLKKQLQKEQWGRPLFYRAWMASPSSSFTPDENGEGILLHDTTHLVDLAFFLFGEGALKQEGSKNSFFAKKNLQSIRAGVKTHHLNLFHRESGMEGSILTSRYSPFFHFEIEIICERARIRVGNGFLSVEKTIKSQLYRNFVSLDNPVWQDDKKMTLITNPFLGLYKKVFASKDDEAAQKLQQSLKNVEILSGG